MTEMFGAYVQYQDWAGTVAADDADQNDMRDFLRERGLLLDGEFLIGFELWLGEMYGDNVKQPSLHVLIVSCRDYETVDQMLRSTPDPLPVKKVDLELSMDEFLLLFKRFAVSMSWKGLDLTGREYFAEE